MQKCTWNETHQKIGSLQEEHAHIGNYNSTWSTQATSTSVHLLSNNSWIERWPPQSTSISRTLQDGLQNSLNVIYVQTSNCCEPKAKFSSDPTNYKFPASNYKSPYPFSRALEHYSILAELHFVRPCWNPYPRDFCGSLHAITMSEDRCATSNPACMSQKLAAIISTVHLRLLS